MKSIPFLFLFALGGVVASAQTVVQNTVYPSGQTTTASGPTVLEADTGVLVPSGATVVYQATSQITLGPGFTAAAGGSFHAYIGATPPDPGQGLSAPLNVRIISKSSFTMTVAWNAPNGSVSRYNIYRNGELIWSTQDGLTFTYTDHPLSPGTTYSYMVSAVDSSNRESAKGGPASDTTDANPDGVDPNNPTKLNMHIPLPLSVLL
jgi:chitinase